VSPRLFGFGVPFREIRPRARKPCCHAVATFPQGCPTARYKCFNPDGRSTVVVWGQGSITGNLFLLGWASHYAIKVVPRHDGPYTKHSGSKHARWTQSSESFRLKKQNAQLGQAFGVNPFSGVFQRQTKETADTWVFVNKTLGLGVGPLGVSLRGAPGRIPNYPP